MVDNERSESQAERMARLKAVSEEMQRRNREYCQARDGFIEETLPHWSEELAGNIEKAASDNLKSAVLKKDCPGASYAFYRDCLFAVRDQYVALGFTGQLHIYDNHEFRQEGTIQPTHFQFELTVSWGNKQDE